MASQESDTTEQLTFSLFSLNLLSGIYNPQKSVLKVLRRSSIYLGRNSWKDRCAYGFDFGTNSQKSLIIILSKLYFNL